MSESELELVIRAAALVSLLLYFTVRIRRFGISQQMAKRIDRAAFLLLGLAMAIAIWATVDWLVSRR